MDYKELLLTIASIAYTALSVKHNKKSAFLLFLRLEFYEFYD